MSRRRLLLLLSIIGPGIVVSSADNDAGGIATYAQAGATYGFEMLWVVLFASAFLPIVQEMAARMGIVTGKGLSDLIRENFGVRWTTFAMVALLAANMSVTMAEFAGIAASLEIFGISKYLSVPLAVPFLWFLPIRGSYKYVEKVFLILAISLLAYPIAGLLVGPDWPAVAHGTLVPSLHFEGGFMLLLVGLVGTTVTPWMQFALQSSVVDKGLTTREYNYARLDVFIGTFYTFIVCYFIVITAASTLHPAGVVINDAQEAAVALAPVAGTYAEVLFAVGLLGVSLLTGSFIPLSTAYAASEAFGLERGISRSLSEAPGFYAIYTAVILLGAAAVLIPNIPLLHVMILSQDVNGILLPVILIFMLLLVNNRRIMGDRVNGRWFNAVAWGATAVIILFTAMLLVSSIFGLGG